MKKKLFFKLFVFAVIAAFVTVTSCKDYDDDISNLENQIAGLSSTLTELKGKVDAGAVITKVESTADGVRVTLSDGKTFDLKNGVDGVAGAKGDKGDKGDTGAEGPGTVITANPDDGFWYINGVKSEYPWKGVKGDKGEQGAPGEQGPAGPEGPAGKDGIIYEPNEDGFWYKVENGVSTKTESKWLLPSVITAMMNDKGDVTFFNVKAGNGTNSLTLYNSKFLRSLTFIPDYTSADGTPQIVVRGLKEWENHLKNTTKEAWRTKTSGTIYKGVSVLKYNLSPSNAKLEDFEVVAFLHQVSLVRSTGDDFLVLTESATVENGVLSVPVLFGENTYNNNGSNVQTPAHGNSSENHSVALQVKINDEGDDDRFVVSSEYVKVNFDLETAHIALNGDSEKADGTLLPTEITYVNIASANHPADIKLWNGKGQGTTPDNPALAVINLNDYIYGVFDTPTSKKLLDYGFDKHNFSFELVNLETEGTDQSKDYVILNGETGELKVKPAGNLVNQAAVGRTPVILVKAIVEGKTYAVGYVKVIITDKFDTTPVRFEFTLEDYVIGCNSDYKLTNVDMTEIDFDQIFNHERIQLGKDAFFAEYKQTLTNTDIEKLTPTPASATVGIAGSGSHVEFRYAINPATQSVNLYNYLEGDIKNNAPAGTYKVKTVLKSNGYRPNVEITWNFKVKLPEGINLNANSSILKENKVIVNPTILEQGGKTSAAYESLLNNVFMHSPDDSFTYTGLTEDCEDYLTPYFEFTSAPSGYTLSLDKTKLLKGGSVAATIEKASDNPKKFFIRLNVDNVSNSGSWGNYPILSEASKGLVGKSVSVQPRGYINGATYNSITLHEPFNVEFTYPLQFVLPTDASVYDQSNQELNVYTFNPYDPTTALIDWNGAELNINTEYGRELINHYEVGTKPVVNTEVIRDWVYAGPFQLPNTVRRNGHFGGWWYAPQTASSVTYSSPFIFDTAEAKCNINSTGDIVSNIEYPIPAGMQLKYYVVDAGGSVIINSNGQTINVPTTYAFTWFNGATGAIQEEFKVAIPVSVTHKWGVLKGNLVITVKPGSGN